MSLFRSGKSGSRDRSDRAAKARPDASTSKPGPPPNDSRSGNASVASPPGTKQGTPNSGTPSTGTPSTTSQPTARSSTSEDISVANIGKSIIFKGELSGDEDLEIDGNVEGRIQLPSHQLTVGAHGKVAAELHAKAVIVVGHVTGNVTATERVEIQATGVVDGDVKAPKLLVQEGAVVNGTISMTKQGASSQADSRPAAAQPERKSA